MVMRPFLKTGLALQLLQLVPRGRATVPEPNAHEGGERSKQPHERGVVSPRPNRPATAAATVGGQKHLPENPYTAQQNEINHYLIEVDAMRRLAYQFKQMCDHTKSGSYSSRASRLRRCSTIARDLETCGFRNLDIQNFKPKHIEALVALWKERELAIGTVKNNMIELRRLAEYIGKENIVKRTNREYGIDNRTYVTNVSKANEVTNEQLAHVTDPYTKASLRLQRQFALRREESIKIQPEWADLGDRLRLQDSWTKGGKYREVPIITAAQRAALDDAKALAGKGSLIPKGMRYKDQLERFKAQCHKAGISHVHGLRHHYSQERYEELTGWKAPACGGPTSKQLTPEQKERDRAVRLLISKELGHEREQITAVYLGR